MDRSRVGRGVNGGCADPEGSSAIGERIPDLSGKRRSSSPGVNSLPAARCRGLGSGDEVAVQLPRRDPMVDRPTTDPEGLDNSDFDTP